MKIGFHQLHGRTLWTKAGLMEEKRARRSIISRKSLQSPYLYLVLYHHLISIAVYADLGRPQDSDIRPRSTKTASLPPRLHPALFNLDVDHIFVCFHNARVSLWLTNLIMLNHIWSMELFRSSPYH
jgi:hypothetical protein